MCRSYWKRRGLSWGRSCLVRHVWILGLQLMIWLLWFFGSVIPFPSRPVSVSVSTIPIPSHKSPPIPAATSSPIRPSATIRSNHSQTMELTSLLPPNPHNISQNCVSCGLTFGSEPASPYQPLQLIPSRPMTMLAPATPRPVCGWKGGRAPFRHIQGQERKSSRWSRVCTCTPTLKSQNEQSS